jgi:cell shape-determining protein MreC
MLKFQIPNNLKTLWDKANWYIKMLEKEIDNLLFENEKLASINKKLLKENKALQLKNKSLKNENQALKLLLKEIYNELEMKPKIVEKSIEKNKISTHQIY